MRDRLDELSGYNDDRDETFLDLELQIPGYANAAYREDLPAGLEEFFDEVSRLSKKLDKLQDLSEDIHSKQDKVLCSTSSEEVFSEKQILARLKEEFSLLAKGVQESLANMKEQQQEAAVAAGGPAGCGLESRMRHCQFNALLRRHTQVVGRHYSWETEYAVRLREQIARQMQLAGLQLGEEEIQRLAESPRAPQIVGSDIQALEARRHLALAQERHRQLLALEEQVGELHGLFLSLGVLVSEQQAQVDRIEYHVLRTVDFVDASSQEVKKALQYKRRSRLAVAAGAVLGLCAGCGCLCCASRALP
ncbi:syntaxin-1A-like [Anguilla anguilla]|uniref:syntaxin-1A-like n=1 Tax=Anguilla anguilla TaxID=7936 RepID=UPI0015AAAF3A|nr:syntaxin-1A-like [Anguilla anguilla]